MPTFPEQLSRALADRYRLERELGQGGMATVYLAEDLKHRRQVAIKVLKPELAAVIGAERFLSEIQTTATLQHPHILALFDSGVARVDGPESSVERSTLVPRPSTFLYYVMPFVEGESLRDRLTREKQLPIHDAVRIASEVASALDYAHRHGVIHRDIKPENILLHDGSALVADFGIALAVSNTAGHRMTETGMSLGTPHYMSPEQVMGERALDGRADVYALGCVLYELLAGEPPFTGPTAQAIVAKVMTATPEPVTTYRRTVTPPVEEAILTALQKLPADRFASARDFAAALEASPGRTTAQPSSRLAKPPSRQAVHWLVWAGLAVAVAALGLVAWQKLRAPVPPESTFALALPHNQALGLAMQGSHVAVSQDGTLLVYTGDDAVGGRLWVKSRNSLVATSIPGTEGAYNPFLSPDNEFVGFFTDINGRTLKIVPLAGGPPRTVIATPLGNSGAAWGSDGYIYFDADRSGLERIKPDGTGRESVMPLDVSRHEAGIAWPHVLPGAHTVIMRLRHLNDVPADFSIVAVRIGNGERATVARGVSAAYAAGHLLIVNADGTMETAPFSERTLRLTRAPAAILSTDVRIAGNYSGVDLAVSDDGVLYYLAGASDAAERLEWVDRSGAVRPVDSAWAESGEIRGLALSSDGSMAAVEISHVGTTGTDIWIKQLPAGPLSRLTLDPAADSRPVFSSDGRWVYFLSERVSPEAVFRRSIDGAGNDTRFGTARRNITEVTASLDGHWLVARTSSADSGSGDILAMEIGRDTAFRMLLGTPAAETNPALSPDGRWLAFVSSASGRREVYVRPFPNVNDGVWQISTNGGFEPRWAHSGRELFFRRNTGTGNLMVAAVETTPTFRAENPRPLLTTDAAVGLDYTRYDISRDDQRFLMAGRINADAQPQLVRIEQFVQNLPRGRP